MDFLRVVLLILVVLSIGLTAVGIVNLQIFFRNTRPDAELKRYPTVSIIKALKGLDARLKENLESFCQIDYPGYELILTVAEADDPAIPLVQGFLGRPGRATVRLVIDPSEIGYNPQISNLNNGYKASTGEIVIFNDSDTRATPDFIRRLIKPLEDPDAGIASGPAVYRASRGFWSLAKAMTYNTSVPVYDALWRRFIPITVGAAMAMRREVFEAIGGFLPIANKLTTDQELGKLVARHGYKVVFVPYPIAMDEEPMRFAQQARQIVRWLVAIKSVTPFDYQFLLLTNSTFLSFIFWLFAPGDWEHIIVFAGTIVYRTLTPLGLNRKLIKDPRILWHAWMVLPVDFVLPVLWLVGQWRRRITWRGKEFVVRKGTVVPVKSDGG
jgi:ceramide glucosyltransferase